MLASVFAHPTPYPDVNAALHTVLAGAQVVLGKCLVGMYLHGSLASGGFNLQRSDIDFVVVTAAELPAEMLPALEALHAGIAAGPLPWGAKLEGVYISQQALRRHDPDAAPCPYTNEGRFQVGRLGSDWVIQRHILREHGVVVSGPAPRSLIDPVGPDDLRQAVRGFLHEWWAPMLQNPTRLQSGEYQAYAILTMCRALYTLQHGTIVSKATAAGWAQEMFGERWAARIAWALAWRSGMPANRLAETLDLIRYTVERGCPLP